MKPKQEGLSGQWFLVAYVTFGFVAILVAVAVAAYPSLKRAAIERNIEYGLNTLSLACELYYQDKGVFPAKLGDLYKPGVIHAERYYTPHATMLGPSGELLDANGNPIQYTSSNDTKTYLLSSSGINGVAGDRDDIVLERTTSGTRLHNKRAE
jgi:hypothetical protein